MKIAAPLSPLDFINPVSTISDRFLNCGKHYIGIYPWINMIAALKPWLKQGYWMASKLMILRMENPCHGPVNHGSMVDFSEGNDETWIGESCSQEIPGAQEEVIAVDGCPIGIFQQRNNGLLIMARTGKLTGKILNQL
jgi:hypothetical protein